MSTTAGARRALRALCLTQIVGWGVLYYSFPVALPAITQETGWSTTSATAAFSAALVVAAVVGVPVGRLLDARGPHGLMTAGSVVGVLATLAIAAAPTVAWFAAAWVLAGVAQAAVLYAPAFTALTRWYGPARTRALTVLTLVAGLSSTIFAPATAALLDRLSWRETYVVLAVVLAVTTIPAHAVGLRAPWPPAQQVRPHVARSARRSIATSRAFVLLVISTSLTAFALSAATVHLIPLLGERGLSTSLAAWALGLSGAGQLIGRVAFAPLARRTRPRARAVVLLGLAAATIAAVGLVPGPTSVLLAASITLGTARGAFTLLQSTAISDRWGTAGFGALYGILNAPTTLAIALAPWGADLLVGATGAYPTTYALLAGTALAAAIVAISTVTTAGPQLDQRARPAASEGSRRRPAPRPR
ncbi:MFS transporter [Oerskovia flava]|uniref:MFS transporter n=1 Tax=Oerskovia flava TaxID=2986422 RepID=UPI00223FEEB7|nr:MFS transporter [Oerskovia sp. JB1-3-2]